MKGSEKEQKKKPNTVKQSDAFEDVARRLGCDEDKDRFEEKLGKIVKPQRAEKTNE